MEWLLGFLLIFCGYMVGWHSHPIVFSWIMNQNCFCGSENKFGDCCYSEKEDVDQ